MRIAYDAKRLFCNSTGLGNYSRTLLKNLAELFPNQEYLLYTPKLGQLEASKSFINNPSFKTIVSKAPFKAFWRSFSILNQLKADKVMIYHGLSHEIPFNIHQSGIKSIVTIHDLIFKTYPHTFNFSDRMVFDIKFEYACKNADKIIAISESTKKDIIRFYEIDPDKIEVAYQSINPLFFEHEMENGSESDHLLKQYDIPPNYLLYVGTVEERKNAKSLVKAFAEINKMKSLDVSLVIIGKGKKYKEQAENLSKKLGLEDKILWIDNLENNKHLKEIYKKAIALVYPSFYEGFGLPIAEALLCKTPVICSNTSSLPEAAGPGGLYFDPKEPSDLVMAIEKLLKDSDLQKDLAQKGYEYAKNHFNAEACTRAVLKCYQEVLL